MERFEKAWAPIASIAGAVLLVQQLTQAFTGDRTLFTGILILVSIMAIGAGMWKYAFASSVIPGFPRYKFHLAAKSILVIFFVFFLLTINYILATLNIVSDCCGFVATNTPTQTLPFPTPTTTETSIPTKTPLVINSTPLIYVNNITTTPSITPIPEMNAIEEIYPAVYGDSFPKISNKFFYTEKYGAAIANANCSTGVHQNDKITIKYYVVKAGDTLYIIAAFFGTSTDNIKSINGLKSDNIYPGDIIILPVNDPCN